MFASTELGLRGRSRGRESQTSNLTLPICNSSDIVQRKLTLPTFSHYPQLVTPDQGRNEDLLVNQELCLLTRLIVYHCRPTRTPICPSIPILLSFDCIYLTSSTWSRDSSLTYRGRSGQLQFRTALSALKLLPIVTWWSQQIERVRHKLEKKQLVCLCAIFLNKFASYYHCGINLIQMEESAYAHLYHWTLITAETALTL